MLVYACLRACVRVSEMLVGGYSCVAVFVSVVSQFLVIQFLSP